MCSNPKTDCTKSTGIIVDGLTNATTNPDTPSHHLVFEASPTAAAGSREDTPPSPFAFIRRLTEDGQNLTREQV
jgi:hypothetical protein